MGQAGKLDRRVQFQRATNVDDGLQQKEVFTNHGGRVWAGRRDVSDAERAVAGWIEATVACRFTIRSSSFSRGLTAKDRLICEGLSFDIQGIKQLDRRDYLEITATARADL
ncbi:phage head closure protein [Pseudomonas sp. GX19020]|uniref:phage head closure protein n=1 Tax=Pseudomonas sp. GX19020 TaxID=2942277 RepID=UPI00201A1C34|nr:phage head closure protein [Pseudomonas sp. GX19020]MCL4065339.1 phage head closure protein [Pseudomonas sp. GX19020]